MQHFSKMTGDAAQDGLRTTSDGDQDHVRRVSARLYIIRTLDEPCGANRMRAIDQSFGPMVRVKLSQDAFPGRQPANIFNSYMHATGVLCSQWSLLPSK